MKGAKVISATKPIKTNCTIQDAMIYQFDHFEVDTNNYQLSLDGRAVSVEPLVFNVIVFLLENRHKLVSRQEIFDNIWPNKVVSDTALSNHIKSARKTLGDDGSKQKYIKTFHGRGYQFIGEATELKINKIAVLPFSNLRADPQTDYFSFSIADQIIGQLIYLQHLTTTPSALIRRFENSRLDPMEIGKQLSVDYLLLGNYIVENDEIRLNMELIELSRQQITWRESIKIKFQDVFQLQDKIASKIALELNLQFTPENQSRKAKDISQNPLAYEYYLRSISYPQSNAGHKLAIDMLEKSINLDAKYSPAYVMLGSHKRLLEQHGRINVSGSNDTEGYYLKALSLNPYSVLALGNLSGFYTETNQHEKSAELIKKMLEINSNSAQTHFSLGYTYRYVGLLQESIAEMKTALLIEPGNSKFRSIVTSCFCAGHYKKALEWINLDEGSDYQQGWHGIISYYDNDYQTAQDKFANAAELDPDGIFGILARVFQGFMDKDKAKTLSAIEAAQNSNIIDSENMCFNAMFYAEVGEFKSAISLLSQAIDAGYISYPFINSNRSFLRLSQLPEFNENLKKAKHKQLEFKRKFFAKNKK